MQLVNENACPAEIFDRRKYALLQQNTERSILEVINQYSNQEKESTMYMPMKKEVPIWEKQCLTLEESAAYFGIGVNKLRSLTADEDCQFVLWVGSKRLIKKQKFLEFLDTAYSI